MTTMASMTTSQLPNLDAMASAPKTLVISNTTPITKFDVLKVTDNLMAAAYKLILADANLSYRAIHFALV